MSLHIVILAAGQGTRMYSNIPKVLHEVGGEPMLRHVVKASLALQPDNIHVIIGHGSEQIKTACSDLEVNWVTQDQQLGTGHAVLQALPFIPADSQVLILCGDVPLTQSTTLKNLIAKAGKNTLTLLSAKVENPHGLGRIIRNEQKEIVAIVEERDATDAQRKIAEINSGICCVQAADLQRWLPQLNPHNAQGEYYLTDIIAKAVAEQQTIVSLCLENSVEIQGINNRLQLQQAERIFQNQKANELMLSGVSLADASRIDIRGELQCGKDVFIDINTLFKGKVILGDHTVIEPNCILENVVIGAHGHIHAHSVLSNTQLGDRCHIGPFARLRPGTVLANDCKIGNFVETKNAQMGDESKASHLSYLGDVTIGKHVNIGAGTITCNYDGVNKHQTIIEDDVFIGSDTQLVAPITVGKGATLGAGTTLRKDAPAETLTLSENKQKTINSWKRPTKK